MQLSLFASTILYTAATAWPHYSEPRDHEYQAPKGDDREWFIGSNSTVQHLLTNLSQADPHARV